MATPSVRGPPSWGTTTPTRYRVGADGGNGSNGIDWVRWFVAIAVSAVLVVIASTVTGRNKTSSRL